jgi:hypothetical protein
MVLETAQMDIKVRIQCAQLLHQQAAAAVQDLQTFE